MATFKAQIEDLVGAVGDDTALTDWLQAGTREIINILPPDLKEYCFSKQTFTSSAANSEAETMITGQLGSVYAGSVECRQIRPMDKHKASDSASIQYASATDPVYYIEGNKINILPASSSGVYYVVANPTVAHGSTSIDNFPNEAEYLVVLYASIKGLQRLMNNMHALIPFNSEQDGSYSAALTTGEQGWEQVRHYIENEEDSELAKVNVQSLGTEMQQFMSEYDWYKGQQVKLQQDYDKGLQMLIASKMPVQNTQREAE